MTNHQPEIRDNPHDGQAIGQVRLLYAVAGWIAHIGVFCRGEPVGQILPGRSSGAVRLGQVTAALCGVRCPSGCTGQLPCRCGAFHRGGRKVAPLLLVIQASQEVIRAIRGLKTPFAVAAGRPSARSMAFFPVAPPCDHRDDAPDGGPTVQASMRPDLRSEVPVSDRDRPLVPGLIGPLMPGVW